MWGKADYRGPGKDMGMIAKFEKVLKSALIKFRVPVNQFTDHLLVLGAVFFGFTFEVIEA